MLCASAATLKSAQSASNRTGAFLGRNIIGGIARSNIHDQLGKLVRVAGSFGHDPSMPQSGRIRCWGRIQPRSDDNRSRQLVSRTLTRSPPPCTPCLLFLARSWTLAGSRADSDKRSHGELRPPVWPSRPRRSSEGTQIYANPTLEAQVFARIPEPEHVVPALIVLATHPDTRLDTIT
jgi:hypothetical protein